MKVLGVDVAAVPVVVPRIVVASTWTYCMFNGRRSVTSRFVMV